MRSMHPLWKELVMAPRLAEWLADPVSGALDGVLAEEVSFYSPVTVYEGRADVMHIFAAIAAVMEDLAITRVAEDGAATISFVSAQIDDMAIDGIIDECVNAPGQLVEATLLLRPFDALSTAFRAWPSASSTIPCPAPALDRTGDPHGFTPADALSLRPDPETLARP
jgi:hypothetical protein